MPKQRLPGRLVEYNNITSSTGSPYYNVLWKLLKIQLYGENTDKEPEHVVIRTFYANVYSGPKTEDPIIIASN